MKKKRIRKAKTKKEKFGKELIVMAALVMMAGFFIGLGINNLIGYQIFSGGEEIVKIQNPQNGEVIEQGNVKSSWVYVGTSAQCQEFIDEVDCGTYSCNVGEECIGATSDNHPEGCPIDEIGEHALIVQCGSASDQVSYSVIESEEGTQEKNETNLTQEEEGTEGEKLPGEFGGETPRAVTPGTGTGSGGRSSGEEGFYGINLRPSDGNGGRVGEGEGYIGKENVPGTGGGRVESEQTKQQKQEMELVVGEGEKVDVKGLLEKIGLEKVVGKEFDISKLNEEAALQYGDITKLNIPVLLGNYKVNTLLLERLVETTGTSNKLTIGAMISNGEVVALYNALTTGCYEVGEGTMEVDLTELIGTGGIIRREANIEIKDYPWIGNLFGFKDKLHIRIEKSFVNVKGESIELQPENFVIEKNKPRLVDGIIVMYNGKEICFGAKKFIAEAQEV